MTVPESPGTGAFVTRGQPAGAAVVTRAVLTASPPQALLLVGPAGTGKTTLAQDLAAGLLCTASPEARPCRACAACRRVAHGNHPDLHRLAPEGPGRQVRIGNRDAPEPGTVRRLLHELALAPAEGAFRVAVIEEAHRLNEDAQNALLKALEEPPPGTCIVLCAEREDLLLPTVRSRCVRVRCGAVPEGEIAALLVERGLADPPRAARLAAMALGRPGRALALARAPEAVLLRDRIVRQILDLARAAPAARLAAAADLLSSADEFEAQLERNPAGLPGAALASIGPRRAGPTGRRVGPRRDGHGEGPAGLDLDPAALLDPEPPEDRERAESATGERTDPAEVTAARARPVRMAPAERRRGLLALGALWRDLARDLAFVLRGARSEVRQRDLLSELEAAAAGLDAASVTEFLAVLDRSLALADVNANPELVLDMLLLRWPRQVRVA